MTKPLFLMICMAAAVFTLLSLCHGQETASDIASQLNLARDGGIFHPPSAQELERATVLFYRLFSGKMSPQDEDAWKQLGFSIQYHTRNTAPLIIVAEQRAKKTGRGFYIFSASPARPSVLMIPHSFYDYHTADIGRLFMLEGDFSAAAFNTVHRFGNKKMNSDPDIHGNAADTGTWDMAKRPATYFTAFTWAFAAIFPQGKLFQLHGFAADKRTSETGQTAQMIISAGSFHPPAALFQLRDCLRDRLSDKIGLYPLDIKELGGTQNIIGDLMHDLGHAGFIHIEISAPMRNQLVSDPLTRQNCLKCMEETRN